MINYVLIPLNQLISSANIAEDVLLKALSEFSCECDLDLQDFLRVQAISREKSKKSTTYLFLDEEKLKTGEITVMAYISHALTSIDVMDLSVSKLKKMFGDSVDNRDNRSSIPAFLIGQLGRSDKYSTVDLPGSRLLYESISILKENSESTSGDVVILECKPHMLPRFYSKFGFQELPCIHDNDGTSFKIAAVSCILGIVDSPQHLNYMKRRCGKIGKEIFEENRERFGEIENIDMKLIEDCSIEYAQKTNNIQNPEQQLITLHGRLSKFEFV
ncbi:hypothetical protein ERUR111494_06445 [Erysipelothrix urinaevulpis]|uniref:hypothetical protein n=1 Tax=Erysipelothrix urinaevulpis TaxID=2683717 RepID=UPI001356AFEA|nr:hypothetical protein [Erysipelothrix urinaevulpis]